MSIGASARSAAEASKNVAAEASPEQRQAIDTAALSVVGACGAVATPSCSTSFADLSVATEFLGLNHPSGGTQVPIAATPIYGQSGPGAVATTCYVGAGAGSRNDEYADYRDVLYSGSVYCPSSGRNNVKIHITEVSLKDAVTNAHLGSAQPYGPFIIEKEGGTAGAQYTRTSDTQLQYIKIQAYVEIVHGSSSSNGWHVIPPACTKLSRLQVRCDFNSGAFGFIPSGGYGAPGVPGLAGAEGAETGSVTGVETDEVAGFMGSPEPTSSVDIEAAKIVIGPGNTVQRYEDGAISADELIAAPGVETCVVSFRRRIRGLGPYTYDWGGRTACNPSSLRMSGQAFLRGSNGGGAHWDSGPGYGPLTHKNQYDGNRKVMSRRPKVSVQYYTNVTMPKGFYRGVLVPTVGQVNMGRGDCNKGIDPSTGRERYMCEIISKDFS